MLPTVINFNLNKAIRVLHAKCLGYHGRPESLTANSLTVIGLKNYINFVTSSMNTMVIFKPRIMLR